MSVGNSCRSEILTALARNRLREKNLSMKPKTLEERRSFSLLVEPRSLLVVKDDLYCNYLHGIAEKDADDVTDDLVIMSSKEVLALLPSGRVKFGLTEKVMFNEFYFFENDSGGLQIFVLFSCNFQCYLSY